MEKKIKTTLYVVFALILAWETYRLYKIEKQVEEMQKLEIQCKKPQ